MLLNNMNTASHFWANLNQAPLSNEMKKKAAIVHKRSALDKEKTLQGEELDKNAEFFDKVESAANFLAEAEKGLRSALDEVQAVVDAAKLSEENPIALGTLLAYAQRMSGTTSAPPYWKPGMPMIGFIRPAPHPELMRAGALHAFSTGQQAKKPLGPESVKSEELTTSEQAPEPSESSRDAEVQNQSEDSLKRGRDSPAPPIFRPKKKAKFDLGLSSSSEEESEDED
mmetsp:Transcript_4535/g.6252  ORF Transcript_4535/g.6252 Transcript_4535/m.6252 type:complete len:227 (-) Transcript_4535:57-737(-)